MISLCNIYIYITQATPKFTKHTWREQVHRDVNIPPHPTQTPQFKKHTWREQVHRDVNITLKNKKGFVTSCLGAALGTNIAFEHCHLVHWFTHYKWWFSSSQTVSLPEGNFYGDSTPRWLPVSRLRSNSAGSVTFGRPNSSGEVW